MIFTESGEFNITIILAQIPIINKAHFRNPLFYCTGGLDVFQSAKNLINNQLNYCILITTFQSNFAKKHKET